MPRHHWRRVRSSGLPTLLLVSVLAGCQLGEPADELPSDSMYVEVMARLSLVHAQLVNRDPAAADSARQAILEQFGIEPAALQLYARHHGDNPEHMQVIWEAVSDLTLALDSIAKAERATSDTAGTSDIPDPSPDRDGSP